MKYPLGTFSCTLLIVGAFGCADPKQQALSNCGVESGDHYVVNNSYRMENLASRGKFPWEILASLIFNRVEYAYCEQSDDCEVGNLPMDGYRDRERLDPVARLIGSRRIGATGFYKGVDPELDKILPDFPYSVVITDKFRTRDTYAFVPDNKLVVGRFSGEIRIEKGEKAIKVRDGETSYRFCVLTSSGDKIWEGKGGESVGGMLRGRYFGRLKSMNIATDRARNTARLEEQIKEEKAAKRSAERQSRVLDYQKRECSDEFIGTVFSDPWLSNSTKKMLIDSRCIDEVIGLSGVITASGETEGFAELTSSADVKYRVNLTDPVGREVYVQKEFWYYDPRGYVVTR